MSQENEVSDFGDHNSFGSNQGEEEIGGDREPSS
jgi:hypothetical protein